MTYDLFCDLWAAFWCGVLVTFIANRVAVYFLAKGKGKANA